MPEVSGSHQDEVDELRRLLDLAEDFQWRYEAGVRRTLFVRVIAATIAVTGLGFGLFYGLWYYGSNKALWGLLAAVLSCGYAAILESYVRIRFRARTASDARALKEIVELTREVERTQSLTARWTPLEQAEFRIRLSRFGI